MTSKGPVGGASKISNTTWEQSYPRASQAATASLCGQMNQAPKGDSSHKLKSSQNTTQCNNHKNLLFQNFTQFLQLPNTFSFLLMGSTMFMHYSDHGYEAQQGPGSQIKLSA